MSEEAAAAYTSKKIARTPRRQTKTMRLDDATVLHLQWTLHELPSSQHRAGLAGLALCVGFLKRRSDRKGICEIETIDEHGMTLAVDRMGMESLFDDVYDASLEEQGREKKLQKGKGDKKADVPPKRTEERDVVDPKTQKSKTRTFFIYDQVVPRGALIDALDPGLEGNKLWLKLWRDVVWSVLRGVPATREPYDARAEGRPVDDGTEAWRALAEAPHRSVDLPSTYAIGAQAKSAEDVAFKDVERFRFVLHFWPFVASIYVPATLDRDGKRDFNGFALVMPDIASLEDFVEDWPKVVRGRSGEAAGYRPREAVIDVAGEGGLDVFRRNTDRLSA